MNLESTFKIMVIVMSAKEMFEELNFILVENTDNILKYKNSDDAIVEFNKIDKNYITYWGNREHDFDVYVEEAIVVDFKLHKAINKQIEELEENNE